ncbi:MAG: LytR C-terminal domain-containing protein [Gemmatimonadaceae bacterium]
MTSPVPPMLHEEPQHRSTGARIARFIVAFILVIGVASGGTWWWKSRAVPGTKDGPIASTSGTENDTLARAPTGVRVRVRVVNTTQIDGLAKIATALLRDRGFDVVDYDADKKKLRETTLVQTNTGHDDWSERVLRALGVGATESRPDSSRYVDVTVLIGSDWKPPAQPFRP